MDPVRITSNLGSLGVGKLEEDAEYTNADNVKRKALETEVERTPEEMVKREVLFHLLVIHEVLIYCIADVSRKREGHQTRGITDCEAVLLRVMRQTIQKYIRDGNAFRLL